MKYLLLLILSISLLSLVSAETTFSDNPNYFYIEGYQTDLGSRGISGGPGGGGNVDSLLGNGTLEFQNLTNPTTNVTNVTIIQQVVSNQFIWIVLIAIILLYFYSRDKKKEQSYN